MKRTALTALLLAAALTACPSAGRAENDGQTVQLETMDEKVSYQMGFQMGETISWMPEGGFDIDLIIAGIRDGTAGRLSQLPPHEREAVLNELHERSAAAAVAQHEALAAKNLEETEAFLEDNAKREGVFVTGSGLQYEVLEDYEGASPHLGSRVLVHFTIEDLSGTVHRDTYAAEQPAETILTNLVEGWQEGLQLMSVGDKYRFYVPPNLAYGEDGGPFTEPNAVMVSTIELLSVYDRKSQESGSDELLELPGE